MNIKKIINVKLANMDISKQKVNLVFIVEQNNMEVQLVMNVYMKKINMEMKKITLYVKIASQTILSL